VLFVCILLLAGISVLVEGLLFNEPCWYRESPGF